MPPARDGAATAPSTTAPTPETSQAANQPSAAPAESAPSGEVAGGTAGGANAYSGYIDQAIPQTQFRVRFDAGYGDNRPDRAEFFYAKCGCFRALGIPAKGPGPFPETSVDFQELSGYLEYAFSNRLSAFFEAPVRFLNAEVNPDHSDFGDVNFGAKYAIVASEGNYLTAQFRTYSPTGDEERGLGTGHWSLEPALLAHLQLSCRLALDAEFRDWIPLTDSDFAGNVTRYGVGVSYVAYEHCNFRIIPVIEFVGWTVLGGKELAVPSTTAALTGTGIATQDADGDTIVNGKFGVRFALGSADDTGMFGRSELYVGYGRALTGDVWYKDMLRAEYRMKF
jgi:hypothetical protein